MFIWSDRTGRLAGAAVAQPSPFDAPARVLDADGDRAPGDPALARRLADESIDLLDLALALEVDFTVVAAQLQSGNVRTYGELTDALLALTRSRLRGGHDTAPPDPFVWIRIVPGDRSVAGTVHAGALSDGAVRAVTEAAFAGGRGTRIEVTVARGSTPGGDALTGTRRRSATAGAANAAARARTEHARDTWVDADELARVGSRFALLQARGIDVDVRRPDDAVGRRVVGRLTSSARRFWRGHGGNGAPSAPPLSGRLNIAVGSA